VHQASLIALVLAWLVLDPILNLHAWTSPRPAGREKGVVMPALFWNAAENRLRAGWRIAIQVVLIGLPLAILGLLGVYSTAATMATRVAFTALPITLLSILVLGRYVDKRRFSDYGLLLRQKEWWADYGFGCLAGFLAAASYVLLLNLLGWAHLSPSRIPRGERASFAAALGISLLTYAAVGVFEELVRSYQIRNITEGLARTRLRLLGATLSAVFLAGAWSVVGHAASGDPSFLVFAFVSAVIYGFFFPWTRRVALAMAMHFAWDFTLSSVFLLGAPGAQEATLFVVSLRGVPDAGVNVLPIVGMLPKLLGLALVAAWIWRREGKIKLHRELASPSLAAR
jgi:membrane protease YdiL (CAAX protease family)